MNLAQVENFFEGLGRELTYPVVIVLTGGVAASLLANPRITDDIDFAIVKAGEDSEGLETILMRAAKRHRVVVQYSRDIDRWSAVSYLDWNKHSRSWRNFGRLKVRILDPYYWSIGKIARGTDRDVLDLEMVFRAQKVDWKKAAKLWARALCESPPSTALFNAKQRMEFFWGDCGKKIWGKNFDVSATRELFNHEIQLLKAKNAARIAAPSAKDGAGKRV